MSIQSNYNIEFKEAWWINSWRSLLFMSWGGADSSVFLGLIYFVFVVLSYILLLVFIIAVQMWRASFEKLVFENSVLTLNECVTLRFSENCHRSCLKTFSLVLPTHSWCTTAEINWGVEGNFKVFTILAITSNKTLWL